MCRLVVYRGQTSISLADLLIAPSHSIIAQSHACRERLGDGGPLSAQLNADGFGIGWYAPPGEGGARKRRRPEEELQAAQAGLFTSICPAWNDPNLGRICNKVSSRLVFAHVRAASIGSAVHEFNCHPFACQRYMFMHNGHVAAFATKMRRRFLDHSSDRVLSSIRGTTDSEHLFAVLLTEIEKEASALLKGGYRPASGYGAGVEDAAAVDPLGVALPPETLQTCMLRTIWLVGKWRHEAGIESSSLLNLCLTDGETVLATRVVVGVGKPASLYYTSGTAWAPRRDAGPAGAASATGVSGSLHMAANGGGIDFTMVQTDRREHAVIIASERLTACQEDWLPVPRDTMLVVHPSMAVLKLPVPQYVPEGAALPADRSGGATPVISCATEAVGDPGHAGTAAAVACGARVTIGGGDPISLTRIGSAVTSSGPGTPPVHLSVSGVRSGRPVLPSASLQQLLASPTSASKVITTTTSSSNSTSTRGVMSIHPAVPPLSLDGLSLPAPPPPPPQPPALLFRSDFYNGGAAGTGASQRGVTSGGASPWTGGLSAPPEDSTMLSGRRRPRDEREGAGDDDDATPFLLLAAVPPAKRPRGSSDEASAGGADAGAAALPAARASGAAAGATAVADVPDTARVQMACQGRSFFGATLSAWGAGADCCGTGLTDGGTSSSGVGGEAGAPAVLVVQGAAAMASR